MRADGYEPLQEMHETMNRLRGHLFEALESFGLSERQENATKRLVRRITADGQARLESIIRERI